MKKSIQKKISFIMMAVMMLFLFGSVPSYADEGLTSKAVLMANIERMYPDMVVRSSFYDDFDGDGLKELFVISGGFSEVDAAHGIYFSSYTTTARLADNIGYLLDDSDAKVADVGNSQKLFYLEVSAGGSDSWTYCFYVKDGVPMQVERELSSLTQLKDDYFMIAGPAFDLLKDSSGYLTGHTYKMYYIRWEKNTFKEYKSKYIKKSVFKKYKGASAVLKKINKKGYKVDKIIQRDNGIININVSKYTKKDKCTTYHNLTLSLVDNEVSLIKLYSNASKFWDKYSFGGIYDKYIFN
ncbi:MAG: hypothetical protein K6F00_01490 [Lachnospiraceae bacterium]|nr:hypothetical protein [Lachnospiraceae bacterium]